MKRYGSVIKLHPEIVDKYKELHSTVWPNILNMITKCNITNYSIYYKDLFLFSYYEYISEDYQLDMEKMASDPTTKEWWKLTDLCQVPLKTRAKGERWSGMEEVFHSD